MDRDIVQRFLFEEAPVRGEMVHLDATWSALLEHQSYPEPVRDLLGQMLAAGALLAATIKFDAVDVGQLFAGDAQHDLGPTRH